MQNYLRRHLPSLLVLGIIACLVGASSSDASSGPILHLEIRGIINPVKARYVRSALERARGEHAALVLVSIDTPGGLVSSMQDITSAISNSQVPVIGFVEPKTGQATSAGAFILLSTDVAAMAPDARVGAAHPVGSGGENLPGTMEQKATNSLVSLSRSLAARRGRPEKLAESMVRDSTSYTADEALKETLVELVVSDRTELLARLDGRRLVFPDRNVTLSTKDAPIEEVPLSWTERLLDAISDPTIASLLVSIGGLGIVYELSAPGIGLGGIVGTSSLLLGLLAMSALPIHLAGLLLLLAGFVALGLEVKVPSHGLLGLGGLGALIIGAIVLVDEGRYFGAPQHVDWRVFAPIVAIAACGLFVLATVAAKALAAPPQSGVEAMRGLRGTVKTSFLQDADCFCGTVFVDGARWQAIADGALVPGEAIEVVEVLTEPRRLRVKRVS